MVKTCCIKLCKSEAYGGCAISFFSFPKNETLCRQWLDVVPFKGKYSSCSSVCSLHFKNEDIIVHNFRSILKPDAVPSIFPGGPCNVEWTRRVAESEPPSRGCGREESFPRNDELRQRWLEVVPFKTKSNHSFICSQRFKSEDKIFHGVKSTLKPNAIPNLFLFEVPSIKHVDIVCEPDEYLIEKSSAQNDNDSNASNLDEESNSIAYVSKKRRRSDSSSDSSVVQSVQSNEIPNDEFQIFGNYVASELRSMHYEKNIKELKRVIQQHIVRWTEEDDREYFLS